MISQRSALTVILIAVGFVALVVTGCIVLAIVGDTEPRQTQPAQQRTASGPVLDASGRMACRRFRDVQRDAAAGIITHTELRAKLQQINGSARVSENQIIRREAEAMLRAVTTGEGHLENHVRRMADECAKDDF